MNLLEKYIIDGNFESIQAIVNGNDFKLDSEWNDYTLLKKALIYKHKDITKFFIAKNFRVNKFSIRDADTTPLHIAVELEWKDVVLLLLEKGASVEVHDSASKLTPMQLSFFTRKYEITDLMLHFDKSKIFDIDKNTSHLHIACARNCVRAVKRYLHLGESIESCAGLTFMNWFGYKPLHFAVDFQSKETVELLLKCGASITAEERKGNTPLHLASNLNDRSLIDLLLLEHKYTSINPKNLFKVTHFHIACTRNNPKVVYGFLQSGVNINSQVDGGPWGGYTALNLAVIYQCVDVVKLLLSQDNLQKDKSESFLFDVYKTENSEIINLITSGNRSLLTTELNNKILLKPLFRACIKGDKNEIISLLSSGVSVNEHLPLDSLVHPGATPLHIIVGHNIDNASMMIESILEKDADVIAKDARGLTPIHIIFQKKYMIGSLMKKSKKLTSNISDKNGLSLFHIACAVGFQKVVIWFMNHLGVDLNAAISEDMFEYPGYTALHMAAGHSRMEVFLKLLRHGANPMVKNSYGLTPLDLLIQNWSMTYNDTVHIVTKIMSNLIKHYRDKITFDGLEFNLLHAACIVCDCDMVQHCVRDQTAVNSALNSSCGWFSGFTPLHFAVLMGNEPIIKILLDHGADPRVRAFEGDTPLHMSMKYLKYSINFGAEDELLYMPNFNDKLFLLDENPFGSDGFSHFHIACQFNRLDVAKAFLDRGIHPDIRTRRPVCHQEYGETWIKETGLHAAMRTGHQDVVTLLLERGADAKARDVFQHTPLHKVLHNGGKKMVKLLVECGGADVNARNHIGETPFHMACYRDLRPVVEALLEVGADFNLLDDDGHPAFRIAADMYGPDTFSDLLIPIVEHALRLKLACFPISEENEAALVINEERVTDNVGEDFKARCTEELQRMGCVRLDGTRMTLRDVISISDSNQLRVLAGNETFQRLVEDNLSSEYPIYGYLVRLQFRQGYEIRQINIRLVPVLKKFVERYCRQLPDECAEMILSYLTIEDLEHLSQAAK